MATYYIQSSLSSGMAITEASGFEYVAFSFCFLGAKGFLISRAGCSFVIWLCIVGTLGFEKETSWGLEFRELKAKRIGAREPANKKKPVLGVTSILPVPSLDPNSHCVLS